MAAGEATLSGPLDLHTAVLTLAVALGCGLLMGVERERRKGRGPRRGVAGVRSFALAALMGALAMVLQPALGPLAGAALVLAGAGFIGALAALAYARDRANDPGLTTEIALLLAYLTGVLAALSPALAAALAVVITALLAARSHMHRFARDWLQPAELRDGIVLAAFVLVVLPLVPDRPLWGETLNPRTTLRLFIVLLAIQALAHLARRMLAARHAGVLSALAAGFVSSTACVAALGLQQREGRLTLAAAAGAALVSCVATLLQLLVVAAAVQPGWLGPLLVPALAGTVAVAAWGWSLLGSGERAVAGHASGAAVPADPPAAAAGSGSPAGPGNQPLFSLRGAALIALALAGIQAGVKALSLWLGDAGVLVGALLAALVDVHAAAAALLAPAAPADGASAALAARALALALAVHNANKLLVAALSGGLAYALRLAPALLAQALLFALALMWTPGVLAAAR